MRDRVEAEELAHDLSHTIEFEKLKDEYIDQAESGESTDWVAELGGNAAKDLLAEIAWFVWASSRKLDVPAHIYTEGFRASQIRDHCKPYIDKWADKQAKKELDR